MVSRILLSIIIGLVAWGLTFIVGLLIALIPPVVAVGLFVQSIAWIVGIIAGIYYFVTQRNPIR